MGVLECHQLTPPNKMVQLNRWIAKSMTSHYNKRKRGGTDEEDNDSSNDAK